MRFKFCTKQKNRPNYTFFVLANNVTYLMQIMEIFAIDFFLIK